MRQRRDKQQTAPREQPAETPPAELAFVRWIEQLETDLASSVGGVLLRGARVAQIENARRPTTAPGALVGYTVRETAGAAAVVNLRDGGDVAGDLVVTVALAAGASETVWFGPGGLNLAQGLYVDVAAGDVAGAVYLRGVD